MLEVERGTFTDLFISVERDDLLIPGAQHVSGIGELLLPEFALPLIVPGTTYAIWRGRPIGSVRVRRVLAPGEG